MKTIISNHNSIIGLLVVSKIGSTDNGTVHDDDFLAAIKKRLYLCSILKTVFIA